MDVHGIYASEWGKFHPEQFVNIWQFQDYARLVIWGTSEASHIPECLADEDLDDFVLEPINEEGETIRLADAIKSGKKYVSG